MSVVSRSEQSPYNQPSNPDRTTRLLRKSLASASCTSLYEAASRTFTGCCFFLNYLISNDNESRNLSSFNIQKGNQASVKGLKFLHSYFFPKPQKTLSPKEREHRIIRNAQLIEAKLKKQFDYAQNQAMEEPIKLLDYLHAKNGLPLSFESKKVGNYEVGICHFQGQRPTMEDESLAISFRLEIKKREYPVQLFGVFDGHGGFFASKYLKENLEEKLQATLKEFCFNGLTKVNIWNALKHTCVRLNEEFKEISGTTVNIVMILDGILWTANLGDSRAILDCDIQLSVDASPENPDYARGILNRAGSISNGRINGYLGVARAVGDHSLQGSVSARAKITCYPMSRMPPKCQLLLACDGLYEVTCTKQMVTILQNHKEESAVNLAKNIVYSAYIAGSEDNISVIVVKF